MATSSVVAQCPAACRRWSRGRPAASSSALVAPRAGGALRALPRTRLRRPRPRQCGVAGVPGPVLWRRAIEIVARGGLVARTAASQELVAADRSCRRFWARAKSSESSSTRFGLPMKSASPWLSIRQECGAELRGAECLKGHERCNCLCGRALSSDAKTRA